MYLSVITATNKHLGPIGALTYKMAAKINICRTILRHCHPMYWTLRGVVFVLRLRL